MSTITLDLTLETQQQTMPQIELSDYFSPEFFKRFNVMQGARFIKRKVAIKVKKAHNTLTGQISGQRGRAAGRLTILKREVDKMAIGDEMILRNSDRGLLEKHLKLCGKAPWNYQFAVGYISPDNWVDPAISECRLSRTR